MIITTEQGPLEITLMQTLDRQVQTTIIKIIEGITQEWDDDDLDQAIDSESQLVEDLGFSSIDFIQLVVAIEDTYQRKLGFHDLLMQNGQYVEDLTVATLAEFVENRLSGRAIPTSSPPIPAATPHNPESGTDPITPTQVEQFKAAVAERVAQFNQPTGPAAPDTAKNKRAIFVLSPPRSGSTLLRIILAGHPQLFAPPELHLLSYLTLADRKQALSGEFTSHLLQGTIRAMMQLKQCPAEVAQQFIEAAEGRQLGTKQFYHLLQSWMPAEQMLVDKTPTYAAHLDILQRAEADFEDPLYIHLIRHPYGMVYSYEKSKLERITPMMQQDQFSSRQLAELTWLVSQQNILSFLQTVPSERHYALRFEDLVQHPETQLQSLCQFLGLDLHPAMLNPYQEQQQRMTDGVQVASEMSGDLKFHLHDRINPHVADQWRQFHQQDFLSQHTWDLASSLGYKPEP